MPTYTALKISYINIWYSILTCDIKFLNIAQTISYTICTHDVVCMIPTISYVVLEVLYRIRYVPTQIYDIVRTVYDIVRVPYDIQQKYDLDTAHSISYVISHVRCRTCDIMMIQQNIVLRWMYDIVRSSPTTSYVTYLAHATIHMTRIICNLRSNYLFFFVIALFWINYLQLPIHICNNCDIGFSKSFIFCAFWSLHNNQLFEFFESNSFVLFLL